MYCLVDVSLDVHGPSNTVVYIWKKYTEVEVTLPRMAQGGKLHLQNVNSDEDSGILASLSSEFGSRTRIFVSVLLISTTSLFIYSDVSTGCYMEVQITTSPLDNQNQIISHIHPYDLTLLTEELQNMYPNLDINSTADATYKFDIYSFTLTSGIDDMWESKAYYLSFIIAIWSGSWPYIKLLLLLFFWLYPLTDNTRTRYLTVLDQFGKFSFVDTYISIIMVVTFYLTIKSQIKSMDLAVDIEVIVEIDVGIWLFAIGTFVSMLYSMAFVYINEKMIQDRIRRTQSTHSHREKQIQMTDQKQKSAGQLGNICMYTYHVPDSVLGVIMRAVLMVVMIGNIWLCIDTIYTAPTRYNINGMAAFFVETDILIDTIKEIPDVLPTLTNNVSAAYLCSCLYYWTVIINPILMSIILVLLWIIPMNRKQYKLIYKLLLPLQAWMGLDVFVIGAIGASFELNQVMQIIIDTNFGQLCGPHGLVEQMLGLDCFSVDGHLTYGTTMIFCFVILEWSLLLYTMRYMQKMLD